VTVLVGFSFAELTVVGADSRGIAADDPGDISDDVQKIFKTGFGLMAGAGRSDVIEVVTKRFANHSPASNEEASDLIRHEVAGLGLPDDDQALKKTCWLATYATDTDQGPEAQLALVSRDINYDFGRWPHNGFLIIKPSDFSEEIGRILDAEAQGRFDRHIRNAAPEQRLGLCVLMISGLVKTVAQYSNAVAAHWSVGYHDAKNNIVRVSSIGNNPEALVWR
jgi:hypothetical protein